MSTSSVAPSLFVWRHTQQNSLNHGYVPSWLTLRCTWCNTPLRELKHTTDRLWAFDGEAYCPFCGWSHSLMASPNDENGVTGDQFYFWKELREFAVTDQRVALSELGTHLGQHFADLYTISARRFEELIEDVFRRHGLRTVLTLESRDDGVDIYLLDQNGEITTIVEVKRYAPQRKVGLAIVDRLLGVQLRKGVEKAILVTSSDFTKPAQSAANAVTNQTKFSLDLIDAQKLFDLLKVYNEQLPPLPEIMKSWASSNEGFCLPSPSY